MRVLFAAGAPLDLKNNAKETPLDTARGLKNELAAKLLEAFAEGKTGDGIGQEEEEEEGSDTDDAPACSDAPSTASMSLPSNCSEPPTAIMAATTIAATQ
mmetsp:Transcript_27092/g.47445  ORF Transcript_27092/g.47445 Transcript_27092/m.47445 type:complete len:100 (-) Transcript_27092:237-536(-)